MLKIHKASAGSGKTYQLAYEYIKLLLGVRQDAESPWQLNPVLLTGRPSIAHRRILAITFTNKATEEMKNRIIKNLTELSYAETEDSHPYIHRLMSELGCTFADLRTAAGSATVSLLLDFGFFNVSTIDSFFQTILRTFARELDIQGDYDIRIDTEGAIADAMNMMLDQLNLAKESTKDPTERRIIRWLENRADNVTADDGAARFTPFQRNSATYQSLVNGVKKIFSEDFKTLQPLLRDYIDTPDNLDKLQAALDSCVNGCKEQMKQSVGRLRTQFDVSGVTTYLNSNFNKALIKVEKGDFTELKDNSPASLIRLASDGRAASGIFNKGANPDEAVLSALDKFGATLVEQTARIKTASLLTNQIAQLELIGLMFRYLDNLRKENNVLIIDDTSAHISRIVGGSYVPFIYEHLGTAFRHFLIDEFQDTSRMQWKNLYPLISNSHAERDDSLIIGDTKQAIYRWRNSDSSILGYDLENKDFPDPDEREIHGNTRDENTNYRTAHGIVRFNNRFLPMFAASGITLTDPANPANSARIAAYTGDNVVQQCAAAKAHLASHIEFVPYNESKDAEDLKYKVDIMVGKIRQQHDDEGYKWKDIAVLVREKDQAAPIIAELLKNDIPVQSAESLFLRNATSVRLILGILTMLRRAGVSDIPIRRHDSEQRPRTRHAANMEQALFESRFNFFLNSAGRTPAQAIDMALEPSGDQIDMDLDGSIRGILDQHPSTLLATIEAVLARNLVPHALVLDERDYIAAFCDVALKFSESHSNDLAEFLDWWRDHSEKLAVTPPNDVDAVAIMTIHKAKGLEFGCVHIANFTWKLVDERNEMWLDIRPNAGINLNLPEVAPELIPPMMLLHLSKSDAGYPGSPFAKILKEQQSLMCIDALNLVYVAMTRPVEQLIVYYDPDTNGTVGAIAYNTLRKMSRREAENDDEAQIPDGAFDEETGSFVVDYEPTGTAPAVAAPTPAQGPAPDMPVVDYGGEYYSTQRQDVSSFISVVSLEPAGVDDDPEDDSAVPADTDDEQRKRRMQALDESTQRGVELHNILQLTETPDMLDDAIAQCVELQRVDSERVDEYRKTLSAALTPDIVSRWFNPADRIDTEMSYFLPTDNALDAFADGEIKRIDRLVQRADGTVDVVDYKFTTTQQKAHTEQVRAYVDAVRRILPDVTVNGYLWYIDLGTIASVE